MAEATLTPGQRAMVVAFAMRHGPRAAARRFQVPVGTVKAWQDRHRKREARRAAWAEAARDTPAERDVAGPDPAEDELAQRMAAGSCLRCGGAGRVRIPEVRRGSLLIRRARPLPCPDCGGPRRVVQVVEHGRDAWREAQAAAGDLGLGWSPDEWGLIRVGEVDPDGRRITGRPDAP